MDKNFDTLDYQIIQLLKKDARQSASEIGRQLGINERTIRNRIERLIQKGAIRIVAIVEPLAFNYHISVDIFLDIDPAFHRQIIDTLQKSPQISYLAYGQGSNAISIEARFHNYDEMSHFLYEVLPSIQGVTVKGYALVPLILRNIDSWMPMADDFSK
jgi:DNA-binding Lrp family transcriptional regulator